MQTVCRYFKYTYFKVWTSSKFAQCNNYGINCHFQFIFLLVISQNSWLKNPFCPTSEYLPPYLVEAWQNNLSSFILTVYYILHWQSLHFTIILSYFISTITTVMLQLCYKLLTSMIMTLHINLSVLKHIFHA